MRRLMFASLVAVMLVCSLAVMPAQATDGGLSTGFLVAPVGSVPWIIDMLGVAMAVHDTLYYGFQFSPYVKYVDNLNVAWKSQPARDIHDEASKKSYVPMDGNEKWFPGRQTYTCANATVNEPVLACGGKGY